MLAHHPFERSVDADPEKAALICGAHRLTYARLEEDANRLAYALRGLGVREGDRVAICLENGERAVIAALGSMKAGAVFLFVGPRVGARKLSFILRDCGARALVAASGAAAELEGPLPELAAVVPAGEGDGAAWDALLLSASAARPRTRRIDADLCCLFYTSGSTGVPKGVMLTHLNVRTASASILQYLQLRREDVTLTFSPLSTDYGWYNVALALQAGATAVLETAFLHPGQIVRAAAEHGVTGLALVPTMIALALRFPQVNGGALPTVRYVTSTGQALPPSHLLQLQERLPAARIYSMYGLTECKRVAYLDPEQLRLRPASVGKAIPNTEVWLVDGEGRRMARPGAVGELVVRGSHVMRGYWNRPQETAACLRDGEVPGEKVLMSGDLFRMDDEGYLYFVGRRDDLFKCGGHLVSPREVEAALHEIPGVVMAAVVGVPDEVLGQAVKAAVAVEEGCALTAAQVVAHCRARLESHLVPRVVEVRDALPRTAAGKTDRRALAAPGAQA
jgi:long-chain acyl-CoA synthetase